MSDGRLVVHAHFHQPSRIDPFSGSVPVEPGAAPFHDWNARIEAECYRPNAERGNLARISWDLSPTLASWLAAEAPTTYAAFQAGDRGESTGRAMAQPFHHTILPLASAAERRTEIRWGLRDFELRFGRTARGAWLPETAVDLATLRMLVDAGIAHTILAPWQIADRTLDTRRPYRVELGGGRSIVVAVYDGALSSAASFEPAATTDADRFATERIAPRLSTPFVGDPAGPLVVIATDGELYGHHQRFRDLFLERLVGPGESGHARPFDVVDLEAAVAEPSDRPFPAVRIVERTSWSCHHGVARWSAECPDAYDGRWKAPLRAAFERLAAGIDAITEQVASGLPGRPDPWAARDAYADVVVGVLDREAFADRHLAATASRIERVRFLDLLEAQRWRLAMFASDGWFWDDPIRPETAQVMRAAARAARLVDPILDTRLEARLVDDLELFTSPDTALPGRAIYAAALDAVGQPGPRD